MSALESRAMHVCPKCETANAIDQLSQREYRCAKCDFELAYLDLAVTGGIRGVFGWLRSVGDTIQGRYRIKSVLGKGGFGATYLVEDLKLNGKRRAIKEVPELMFDEYETQLLSRLNHPSIPDITDRTTADGMVYLVLEFGGTRTLASERKRLGGKIPLHTLLPWMRQLCDVLDYLHTQTPPIIHRDLKPENILLDDADRIMLIDFGIAKESAPDTLTRALGRAATHGFSPPEQAMGTGTDERSDIYAMGATLYFLVTGTMPPAAHERVAGKEVVAPSQFVPDISSALEKAVLRALNLNVNHRQQSVREFSRAALDSLDLTASPGAAPPLVATSRTVMVTEARSRPTKKPQSIRLPTGGTGTGEHVIAGGPAPLSAPKRSYWVPLTVAPVLIGAIAGGGYFMSEKSDANKAQNTVGTTPMGASRTEAPALSPPAASVTPALPADTVLTEDPWAQPTPAEQHHDAAGALETALKSRPADPPRATVQIKREQRRPRQQISAKSDPTEEHRNRETPTSTGSKGWGGKYIGTK